MPVEHHRKERRDKDGQVVSPDEYRVRIRWVGVMRLTMACATEAEAHELNGALESLRDAGRRELLSHLQAHTDLLPRLVEVIRERQPGAIKLEHLTTPTVTAETLTIRAAYDRWAEYHTKGGISRRGVPLRPHTSKSYGRNWARFLGWLGARASQPVTTVTSALVAEYRRWLEQQVKPGREAKRLKSATVNREVAAIRAWWRWLRDVEEGLGLTLHDLILTPRKESKKLPRALTDDEQRRVLDAVSPAVYRQLFELLLETGLRFTEGIDLRVDEVDLGDGVVILSERGPDGKRLLVKSEHAERTIPLTDAAERILRPLVEGRNDAEGHVWPAKLRRENGIRSAWNRARKKAGVVGRIHDLRHTFGVALADSGASAAAIRDTLGHADIGTSDRYLRAKASRERARRLAEALNKRRPGNPVAPDLPPKTQSGITDAA